MKRIIVFGIGLIFISLLSPIVICEFQHHELQGKFGDSEISLAWYNANNLKGYISGGKFEYAEHIWKFSSDFKTLEISTSAGRASQSYTVNKAGSGIYEGVMSSAFGMGMEINIKVSSDKITGNIGLDPIDIKINPPLERGEIPGIW